MPKFTQLLKESGVDPERNFMVVPVNGSNLVSLHDAKGVNLRFDQNQLEVRQLTGEQVARVSNRFHDQFVRWGVANGDSFKTFWGAMHQSLNTGLNSRLLMVTGKRPGLKNITAVNGSRTVSLEVAVLPLKTFTIAFKFLQHLDASGAVITPTRWNPSDGRWLIEKLNWIYGPQANISFDMIGADWVKVGKVLGQPLNSEGFLNNLAALRNKNADLNIFFVGGWKGAEAAGTFFINEHAAVVADNPVNLPVIANADPFLVSLAHEAAHFLTDDQGNGTPHYNTPNVLMSTGIESTRINKELLLHINPPW